MDKLHFGFRGLAAIIVFLFTAMSAGEAGAITLDEAVDMALTSSERAVMVAQEARAMRAGAQAGVAELKPHLSLDAGYYELGTNADPNPFFVEPERDYNATLSASQLLWAGGRITKGFRLRGSMERHAAIGERVGMSAIRYSVSVMYYRALLARARADVLRDRVEQRHQEMEDARALGFSGLAAPLDVRQAEVSLNMAREDMLAGKLEYRQALIDFNLELGNTPGKARALLVPEGDIGEASGLDEALRQARAGLGEGTLPELEGSALAADEAALRYGIARGRNFPSLSLVASATSSGEESADMDESWMAGVNLRFDIYDGGLRGAEKSRTGAMSKQAMKAMERTRKDMTGKLYSIGMRAESLSERLSLKHKTVELAGRNYEDARAEYREGLITLTRLGEFNLALAEARLGLLGLYFEQQSLLAETDLLMGRSR